MTPKPFICPKCNTPGSRSPGRAYCTACVNKIPSERIVQQGFSQISQDYLKRRLV